MLTMVAAATIVRFPPVQIPTHNDVIKWKHFLRYWPFVRRIHWSPVNSPHKGQWRRTLMFSLICARISGWVNSGEAGETLSHPLWRHCNALPPPSPAHHHQASWLEWFIWGLSGSIFTSVELENSRNNMPFSMWVLTFWLIAVINMVLWSNVIWITDACRWNLDIVS